MDKLRKVFNARMALVVPLGNINELKLHSKVSYLTSQITRSSLGQRYVELAISKKVK